ncbi:hypothetical protein PFAG_04801 [Plasmodium falciparum Santa Lucia]|uniref:Uncharacterized protein n=2 Tax=Plasmodium falciparum TaxID=5833 RepID=W7FJ15_PLAFA|nr:hypothetical protein PFNF135_06154 [Plasmodium falciparum NF135/5.C10]EUT80157.1 hypothetical protein PFAG_04801 [Plasmodium falciparum Santa Lucia]
MKKNKRLLYFKNFHIMFNKIFFNYLSLKRLTNITQLNHITILFLLYLIIINHRMKYIYIQFLFFG